MGLQTIPLPERDKSDKAHVLGPLDVMLRIPANDTSGTGEDIIEALRTALITGGDYETFTVSEWNQVKDHIRKLTITNQGTDPAHLRIAPLAADDENMGEVLPFNSPADVALHAGHPTLYYECDNALDVTVHFDLRGTPA